MILFSIPKQIAKRLIRLYQRILSFDHSFWARPDKFRICIHYPSCSEYTYQAIDRFGVVKGGIMGLFRILRCAPFTQERIDEVPERFSIRSNRNNKF